MGDSYEIMSKLDSIADRLDRVEEKLGDVSDAVTELEARAAVIADDQAAIRRDIDRLEPGVI